MTDGWTRLTVPGMVNPTLMDTLRSRMEHGTITEDGHVEVDNFPNDLLKQAGDERVDAGTDVVIRLHAGNIYCRPKSEQERAEREAKERREQKQRARERFKDWKARRAREFWNEYQIPVEYDAAIKGRRSGLLRGSDGSGRDASTVIHLFVREAFSDGRLERDGDVYLCTGEREASFQFDGVRRQDSDGNQYLPRVTCETCLNRMKRWKNTEDHDS